MNREQLLLRLAEEVNRARIADATGVATAEVVSAVGVASDGERSKLNVCGVDMSHDIDFYPEGTRSGWRAVPRKTGKMRMNIGCYGTKTQFHEKRDGGFNMEKAASLLVTLAREKILRGKTQNVRRDNEALAELILSEEVPSSINRSQIVVNATDEPGMMTASLRVGTLSNEAGIRRIVRVWVDLIQHGGV